MFKPNTDKEWLMKIVELDGDGFANAGGIRSEPIEGDTVEDITNLHTQRKTFAFVEIESNFAESIEPSTVHALAGVSAMQDM